MLKSACQLAVSFAFGRLVGSSVVLAETTGPSMEPALFTGEYLLTVPIGGAWQTLLLPDLRSALPGRIVTAAPGAGTAVCKRVAQLDAPACDGTQGWTATKEHEASAWLLGDNAPRSQDSRAYGAVPLSAIRGVALAVVWPPQKCRWLEAEAPVT